MATPKKGCGERFCRNAANKGRYCSRCASRRWRAANPLKAFYINQKSHAKARGIPWNLPFEDFEKFAIEERLIGHTGRTKYSYQVDRIDSEKGYSLDNIQKLTQEENVAKEHERRRRKKQLDFDWRLPEFTSWIKKEEETIEAPF